jgi:hypothetical protein
MASRWRLDATRLQGTGDARDAPTLGVPSALFAAAPLFTTIIDRPHVAVDALAPVGIRDAPNQPRAPPSLI